MYIITWLLFWFAGMGLPNYFFKKHKITYYENSWQHVAFFVLASVLLIVMLLVSSAVWADGRYRMVMDPLILVLAMFTLRRQERIHASETVFAVAMEP